jgi:hypothetical protein
MSARDDIHEILIERDITTFIRADWEAAAQDFDAEQFSGLSAESGRLQLRYPTLESYRDSWLSQAVELSGPDRGVSERQLRSIQRIERIEVSGERALAVKVFAGELRAASGGVRRLDWTTFYSLRHDDAAQRWLITGFVGYIPEGWSAR